MSEPNEVEGPESELPEAKSKSQLKREMHELQSFATSLTRLKPAQLDALGLPDKLRIAIEEYKKVSKSHIARKRHSQYLGKLMKGMDKEAIARQINRLMDMPAKQEKTEDWAEKLALELLQQGNDRINSLLADNPALERPTLRQYTREFEKAGAEEQRKITAKLGKYLRSNLERQDLT